MASRALFLVGVILTMQLCECTTNAAAGDGFSVEFIHRDSVKSPFHDPSLTAQARVIAAAQRSTARADALARSYAAGGSPAGAVSEAVSRPWEYLMYVNVGTPRTRILAIVDTGSDLVWFKCTNGTSGSPAAAADAVYDPSSSASYGRVFCDSVACHAAPYGDISCDANSNCQYQYKYGDGSSTTGILATETFTFDDAPGGCVGCRERPQLQVDNVNFGCSTATNEKGTFHADGLIGFGASNLSLVAQIGAGTSLGRRFSYCLVPYSVNASSFLNFGARAAVTESGAVTAPLVPSDVEYFYTVAIEFIGIGNKTFTLPNTPHVIIDSGSTLTYLDKGLFDPMVEELTQSINLPRAVSPLEVLPLCYDVTGTGITVEWVLENIVPDVKLGLGGGAVLTMKAQNTFVMVEESTMCMAVVATSEDQPVGIIGNIAQQDMHVGYDLDKRTVTFAAADCAAAYPAPPTSF